MNDKQFGVLGLIVGAMLVLWYLWSKHAQKAASTSGATSSPGFPENLNWPMQQVPGSAYAPPTIGKLALNISNPNFGMLSNQYIPLFGFVGMAQGTYY